MRLRAERFPVVSVLDDDLAMSYQERLAYAGDRDPAKIAIKPGGKPVRYHVREIPHALWESFVDAGETPAEKYRRAFMAGVERVDNLPTDDGLTQEKWAPNTKNPRTDQVMMGDDDLALFSPAERQEIGSVVYMHSFLPRRIAATYLLPSSLHEPMTAMAYRLAEQSLAETQAKASAGPSVHSGPNPAASEKSNAAPDVSSDNRTAAHAAASVS